MRRMKTGYAAAVVMVVAAACDDPPVEPAPRTGCAAALVNAPTYPFDTDILAARRAALFDQIGSGVAVVSGTRVPNEHLTDGTVRVAPDFYYLTGLDEHEGLLVLIARQNAPDETILFVESVAGGVPAYDATAIDDVRCLEDGIATLDSIVRDGDDVGAQGLSVTGGRFYDETLMPFLDTLSFSHLRVDGRAVKDADERERIREAAAISTEALLAGMAGVAPDAAEGDVKAAVELVFSAHGAQPAFASIIASGPNTLELHYRDASDTMRAGDLVILDIGAEHARYAGDVARTLPVSGTFTPRQRELYAVVLAARQAVLDAFAAGLGPAAAEDAYYTVYAEHWETCGQWCYNLMPHALFHSVGLDVHDGAFIYDRNAAGTVINVEPGLYLPDEGFGMRIEDTILLTGDGYELLTDGLPTTADEIEAFMAASATD